MTVGAILVKPRHKTLLGGLALLVALGACAEPELVLEGERFPIRAPLEASLTEEGKPEPIAADMAPQNKAVPVSLGGQTNSGEWTHRAGNARHLVPHAALGATPVAVWAANVGAGNSRKNRIAAAPIVSGGRVFTMDALATVTATSTAGATLWVADLTAAFDRDGNVSGGGMAAANGRVFAATSYGELVALNEADGAVVWRQRLEAPVVGAPSVDGGTVYVGGRDGSAWAISASDGKIVWQVPGTKGSAGMLGSASPAVGDRAVVFPTNSGELTAVLRIGGGQKVWTAFAAGKRLGRAYAIAPDVTGDPVIAGGTVYAGTAAGRTVAISAGSGQQIWAAGEGAMGPMVVTGGSLFLVNDEARLVRLDAATGEVIWSVEMPYFAADKVKKRKDIYAHYGPVLAGGRLVVASSDGLIRFFNPTDGSLVYSTEIKGGAAAQPAVAGGTLFVVSGNGQLIAYR